MQERRPLISLFVFAFGCVMETEELDPAVCDPASGPFTLEIDHPFFPLTPVGTVRELEGVDDGAFVQLRITVLDETESVAGVTTRVVEEREAEDGELIEVSRNYFAQAPGGTVCYFGEAVDIYEDGEIVSHEGAWRADEAGHRSGILMPANPEVGMAYAQELAPGIAEDRAEIVAMGLPITVPAGTFDDTVQTLEWSLIEPGSTTKIYVRGIGLAVDGPVNLVAN